jgi:P-type conjugative transfer protein TrbG
MISFFLSSVAAMVATSGHGQNPAKPVPMPLAARATTSPMIVAPKPPIKAVPKTSPFAAALTPVHHHGTPHRLPYAPTVRVDAANRAALLEPRSSGYSNAVQVYPWSEGALYRLFAAPERVSDIALQPGEALVSVAAGDTVRWIVGDTTSGAGADKRTHILVKPSAAGLKTNLIIATDHRTYHLQLESTMATSMSAISWTYPENALLALRGNGEGTTQAVPVSTGMSIQNLRFGYTISGDNPAWRPIRAFDDGRQTFIAFPESLTVGEAPPLFIRGSKGEAELVNYRVSGTYYVVDRLFDVAELRLGTKHQLVVTISRDGAHGRRGKGRAS